MRWVVIVVALSCVFSVMVIVNTSGGNMIFMVLPVFFLLAAAIALVPWGIIIFLYMILVYITSRKIRGTRRVLLQTYLIIFSLSCLVFAPNYYVRRGRQGRIAPALQDQIDWARINPLTFLEMLKTQRITVWNNPPSGWIKEEQVAKLMELIDSQVPAEPVCSSLSSYIPDSKSTVGNEAMFLIEGFRKGSYPPELCSVYYFKGNPELYKKWWVERKNKNK